MWKISELSNEFFKWKQDEKQFFDDLKLNCSIEQYQEMNITSTQNPLVFDVPVVPNKISGIFEESNGTLNFTALSKLVNELQFKKIDPPE